MAMKMAMKMAMRMVKKLIERKIMKTNGKMENYNGKMKLYL